MDESTTLREKFSSITIPLLCTYTSDVYNNYPDDQLEEFINEYKKEVIALKKRFDTNNKHKLSQHLNVILILLPVRCKKEIVKNLHIRLTLMQEIGRDV